MTDHTTPPTDEIPPPELAVARAVARRLGRTVYGVREGPGGGRRLVDERPDDVMMLAYQVTPGGNVRLGPAGRRHAAAQPSLVQHVDGIPSSELATARDYALIMGRTVFVAELADDAHGRALHFAPPEDGTLRYVVRVTGDVVVGAAAVVEPAAEVRDPGWTARVGAALRQLRRLRERADELAALAVVSARDLSRVERLIPDAEWHTLRPARLAGAPGPLVARVLHDAAEREMERIRREAALLSE